MSVSTSTSWISSSGATQSSGQGTEPWLGDGSTVTANDNTRARVEVKPDFGEISEYLNCAFSDLAGALPAAATIDGVEVRIEGYRSADGVRNSATRLSSDENGTVLSGTSTKLSLLPTGLGNEDYITLGGAADLWGGSSISRAALIDSGFRVAFQAAGTTDRATTYIDHVQIKVYYTYTPSTATNDLALFWSAP